MSVVQFPTQVPFVDSRNRVDWRWARVLQSFLENAAESNGSQGVTDGSSTTYAPMTLFQGADAAKPGIAETGWLYFALDTGKIYRALGSTWDELSEALTGDITKAAGSNITALANVFFSPGTYGGATQTPVITVDAKGRITNLWFEDISSASPTPQGPNGALQFNQGGVLSGTTLISYDSTSGSFVFANAAGTRENLSPLTTKGDIFVRGTASTRLPVGTNGQVLQADSTAATGLRWAADNWTPSLIPVGSTFTVPTDTQVLIAEDITVDGNLVIDGNLFDTQVQAVSTEVPGIVPAGTGFSQDVLRGDFTWGPLTIPAVSSEEGAILYNRSGGLGAHSNVRALGGGRLRIGNLSQGFTRAGTETQSSGYTTTYGTGLSGGLVTTDSQFLQFFVQDTPITFSAVLGLVLLSNTQQTLQEGNLRGVATLVNGSATVFTPLVTATSRIVLTGQDDNGGVAGFQRVSARNPGSDFTITSSSTSDTSIIYWMIITPY